MGSNIPYLDKYSMEHDRLKAEIFNILKQEINYSKKLFYI